MAPPAEVKAIVIVEHGKAEIKSRPVDKLPEDYLLVRVIAVGLNPTDWKAIYHLPGDDILGAKVGCDYVGIVEEIGSKAAAIKPEIKVGDRIAGFTHGSNQNNHVDGAFAEWITVQAGLQIKVPDNLSNEEAATLGVGISTVGQGLYQSLNLPLPETPAKEPFPVLIYGASTATGILAVQFAKLSGLTVVATASPHNFEYIKSLGADAVFDYRSPTVAADIKAYTHNKLRHAFDCISTAESARISAEAMSDDEQGAAYSCLVAGQKDVVTAANPRATYASTLAYTAFGERFSKGPRTWEPSSADAEFNRRFWNHALPLLADGRIRTAKPDVNREGQGLEGVLRGLELLREGKVSAGKLVYTL